MCVALDRNVSNGPIKQTIYRTSGLAIKLFNEILAAGHLIAQLRVFCLQAINYILKLTELQMHLTTECR